MRTALVKAFALEVRETLPKPYTPHVIDEVFAAIERNPHWLKQYERLSTELTKTVVNAWGAYWVANALGKIGQQQLPARRSTLIGAYSLLDTDARTLAQRPNEAQAREMMAAYYKEHKAELPEEVRQHRELIVELIMQGLPPLQAFTQALLH